MRRSSPSIVRSAALRNDAFKGWNTSSIGLNSGEYCYAARANSQ
jgi:hypothetical protein